nr:helix-turn-helix transcriptional regulator [Brevibacillus laterosporus]
MRKWLIEERKKRLLKQSDVAKLIGISRSYYSEIELETKTPSGKVAKKIADFFKVDMTVFFEVKRAQYESKKPNE